MDELLENIYEDLAEIEQCMSKEEILDRVDDVLDYIETELEPDNDED